MTKQQIHKFKLTLEFDLKLKEKEKLDYKSSDGLDGFVKRTRDYFYNGDVFVRFDGKNGSYSNYTKPSNVRIKLEEIKK